MTSLSNFQRLLGRPIATFLTKILATLTSCQVVCNKSPATVKLAEIPLLFGTRTLTHTHTLQLLTKHGNNVSHVPYIHTHTDTHTHSTCSGRLLVGSVAAATPWPGRGGGCFLLAVQGFQVVVSSLVAEKWTTLTLSTKHSAMAAAWGHRSRSSRRSLRRHTNTQESVIGGLCYNYYFSVVKRLKKERINHCDLKINYSRV